MKFLPKFSQNFWAFIITLVFILINARLMVDEKYYLLALPAFLYIVYLAFLSMDTLFYILVFFVPISVPLEKFMPDLGFNVQLPTDPILVLIFTVLLFKLILERKFDRKVLLHPISIAIYINLAWIFITCLTSTIPVVSFKFLLSRIWFITTFYFLATQIFKKKKAIRKFYWAYIPLLMVVIVYVVYNLSKVGLFNQHAANLAPNPFYNDHTALGAALAMLLPFTVGFIIYPKFRIIIRAMALVIFGIIIFALVISYCRAAWVSILVAAVVLILIVIRIKLRTVLVLAVVGLALFFQYRTDLYLSLEQNNVDSSKDFSKHVQSISNIETDASNTERLNRWNSAFKMFRERPIFGWGPNTYMFKYAPFQMSYDKTIISTNMGDKGNAHSDYIESLADSGILGSLTFILLLIVTLYSGIRLYPKLANQKQTRLWLVCAVLGLVTYFFHAIVNNFLDTDKLSSLFWGYTAMIVAIDVYQVRRKEKELTGKA